MWRFQLGRILLAIGILSGLFASAAAAGVRTHVPKSAMQAEYQIGIDGPRGLVVANRDGIFRTQDGGSTWTKITPPSFAPIYYVHVFVIVAVGDRIWLEMEGADIWDTVPYSWNGGHTWRDGSFGGLGFLSDLVFTNGQDGWVHVGRDDGSRSLYRTTDGGATWVVDRTAADSKIKSPASIVGRVLPARGTTPDGLRIERGIQAVGGLAWAPAWGPPIGNLTPQYLLRSTDGGKIWQLVTGPG
jgi:photosystem II stability/assembly factor-like uncharacterized protein